MKSSKLRIVNIGFLLIASGVLSPSYSLCGRVTDKKGDGIGNALIELTIAGLSTVSAPDGSWAISVSGTVKQKVFKKNMTIPVLKGTTVFFTVAEEYERVGISIYTLEGRLLYNLFDKVLTAGFYSIDATAPYSAAANSLIIVFRKGHQTIYFKMPVIKNNRRSEVLVCNKSHVRKTGRFLEKRKAVIDTVKVSKSGYVTAWVPINSYEDTINVALEIYTPSYHLPPPNPCYNQFTVEGCRKGDPNSACGGNCTVANSCCPPESQDKANLPKTFICPRFMLFSTEMLQAAKDDAELYGWNKENPPFNYAVAGHDAEVGGIDDGPSSCCQCYQLVFEKPEPSSPQPPELPYPKPLIVQSFNTAASGPKGFDIFMGAGGYGAYNSCYNDPAFGNTSKFKEFIYDNYPYQNPGGGGISFLRYEKQCRKSWPPKVADLQSSECQDTIEKLCNQAFSKSSDRITEDTRRSCIQTNKIESLYHQNWEVMVKRVRCPENLTRVTGCRLKEDKLPLPVPDVQTPAQARANGTFRSGYHTTTMQDCCKPTCAWADWVTGQNYKLPADGEWNSFYSCDKNGIPFTK